jgi:hypothetical protein
MQCPDTVMTGEKMFGSNISDEAFITQKHSRDHGHQ